jgi:hypothetical protein
MKSYFKTKNQIRKSLKPKTKNQNYGIFNMKLYNMVLFGEINSLIYTDSILRNMKVL